MWNVSFIQSRVSAQSTGIPEIIMTWFFHFFGIDNESSPYYAFWSGAGSDLSYLSVFVVLFRKHNCHIQGCWRIGHHVQGDLIVCHKHLDPGQSSVQ